MKFACPKCTTRYSIADEKVPPASTLRFPCKKCGTVIRLKRKASGPEQPAAAAPKSSPPVDAVSTRVANLDEIKKLRDKAAHEFGSEHEPTRVSSRAEIGKILEEQRRIARLAQPPPAEQEEWYVLVGGKQKGPMTAAAVMTMLGNKEIDKRTYVWKDGMADWQRLGVVGEFEDEAGRAGPAAWRVMQPAGEPTPAGEAHPFEVANSTVAMNQQQLKRELAKSRAPADNIASELTPVNLEPASSIERLATDVSDPELLNALAGVPSDDRLTRPLEPESSDALEAPVNSAETPHTVPFSDSETAGAADSASYFTDGPDVNPDYVAAPPGESTKLYMATAGLYKRRRTHRIAATLGMLFSVLLVGTVSLDIVGIIQIPGMGLVYDVTGLVDPNKDRAVERVESRLSDTSLDPARRAELETIRRKLLGTTPTALRPRLGGTKAGGDRVAAGEGIKESGTMSQEQKSVAVSVFSDANKRETRVNLLESTEGPAPNLPSGLTQETIFKVITENSRSMNLCLTESMKKGEKLSGKMEIILTIAPDGSVPDAKIDAPEFRNTQMASCTIRRIKSWKFPRFNGDPVTVSYPYLLQMGF